VHATSSAAITSDDVRTRRSRQHWQNVAIDGLDDARLAISYVGDLGWELYAPVEQGAKRWDGVGGGTAAGIVPAGIGVYAQAAWRRRIARSASSSTPTIHRRRARHGVVEGKE